MLRYIVYHQILVLILKSSGTPSHWIFILTSIDLMSGSAVTPYCFNSTSPILLVIASLPLTCGTPKLFSDTKPLWLLILLFSLPSSGWWSLVNRTAFPPRQRMARESPTWATTSSILFRRRHTVAVVPVLISSDSTEKRTSKIIAFSTSFRKLFLVWKSIFANLRHDSMQNILS